MKDLGLVYMPMEPLVTTSEDFSFETSNDENLIYVISYYTNMDFSLANFNYLNVLRSAADGTFSEPSHRIQLPVASTVRPQGVTVYQPL